MPMQYKVLALDLDGTLTNSEKIITPRTKAALMEAAARGVCIVLASGWRGNWNCKNTAAAF